MLHVYFVMREDHLKRITYTTQPKRKPNIFVCLFNRSAPLSEVQDWLKTVPTLSLEPVKCGNNSLDEPVVEAIEEAVRKTKVNNTVLFLV